MFQNANNTIDSFKLNDEGNEGKIFSVELTGEREITSRYGTDTYPTATVYDFGTDAKVAVRHEDVVIFQGVIGAAAKRADGPIIGKLTKSAEHGRNGSPAWILDAIDDKLIDAATKAVQAGAWDTV